VVALQTISDYLDNLCDRRGSPTGRFRQLHLAMTDALDPAGETHDYYRPTR
jgi:tetraprenyl-beta-curcumene synthase